MKKTNLMSAVMGCVVLSGCTVTPRYIPTPTVPIPMTWPTGKAYDDPAAKKGPVVAELGWQEFFQDPQLRTLIGLAIENNRNFRQSVLNVEAYRALHRIQKADQLPTINLGGGGSIARIPRDSSPTGSAYTQSQYEVAVGFAAYELDVFGRVRSLTGAALETYFASVDIRRSVLIALVADVANAYVTWRTDQKLLQVTEDAYASFSRTVRLLERNQRAGIGSSLAVRQARSIQSQADAQRSVYIRQVAQDLNALRLLVGSDLPPETPLKMAIENVALTHLPVGLPSSVLLRRPDIRAAEHGIAAANGNISAARASFFPSISLTADAGTTSGDLEGLVGLGARTWSFGPRISVPIFNHGRLEANQDYAEVQGELAVARYEQAVQTSFKEVSDGLAARGTYVHQVRAQQAAVVNDRQYYNLAQRRYRAGIDNFLTVLDAQRTLFSSQQALLLGRLQQMNSEVLLYKALGGGWKADEAPLGTNSRIRTVQRQAGAAK